MREGGAGDTGIIWGGLEHSTPTPSISPYPFIPQLRSPRSPSTQKPWGGGRKSSRGPLQWQVKGLHPQTPKIVPFSKNETLPLSLHLRRRQLSLGLTALERGKNPHLPASPIHTLAVSSTPALNSEGAVRGAGQ